MKKNFVLFSILFLAVSLFAQDGGDKKFGVSFSGYVKTDFMLDSRQTMASREGHFLLWPMPIITDLKGNDLNEGYNTSFLPIQSQISAKITAPDFLKAKVSGVLEGDFFGTTNADINLLRLRHAYSRLSWTHAELLLGQFWHPLFNPSCSPATVSFNTGAPISPFGRHPQIRASYLTGKMRFTLSAIEQRDYVTYGHQGGTSTYLRNSAIPEIMGEIVFSNKGGSKGADITTGLIFGHKTIVPRLKSDFGFRVNESVSSVAASAFANIKLKPVTIKVTGVYGENISDVMSISGFAVTGVRDVLTGEYSYAPLANAILWTDIHTNGSAWQYGLYAGINKNLGSTQPINGQGPIYGLGYANGVEIAEILRISPRIVYNHGKMRFAAEAEYTQATFGTPDLLGVIIRNNKGLPINTYKTDNLRLLLAAYLFF